MLLALTTVIFNRCKWPAAERDMLCAHCDRKAFMGQKKHEITYLCRRWAGRLSC